MFKKLVSSLALVVLSASANAALVSTDWHASGDNLITRDTTTGLEWLDLTQTFNQSVAGVLPQLGTVFTGFRLATAVEVHTLMGDAGLPFSNTTGTISSASADLAAANALTALLGDTLGPQYGGTYYGSRGHLIDGGNDLVVGYYNIGGSTLFNDYFGPYPTWPGAGVWLVRAAEVPEPSSMLLLGLAGVALFASKRRKAN